MCLVVLKSRGKTYFWFADCKSGVEPQPQWIGLLEVLFATNDHDVDDEAERGGSMEKPKVRK